MKKSAFLFLIFFVLSYAYAQENFASLGERRSLSLDGIWKIIIDPYENGYYDYRWQENPNGFFKNEKPKNKWDRIEYDFDKSDSLNVPGDWNSQKKELFFYEGTIWYKKSFDFKKKKNTKIFLRFGAVNYHAVVYLNGIKLGSHEGGFTPFSFEITQLVREKENFVIVKADNRRCAECVPTLNTDWWNYGGITRSVVVVETPVSFISDYSIQLRRGSFKNIFGWVRINGSRPGQPAAVDFPELKIHKRYTTDSSGLVYFSFPVSVKLWSPENPVLYDVIFTSGKDTVRDQIGFRTVETKGTQILLNGKPVFLRGISIHEEAPFRSGRAYSQDDARILLGWAKELGCNFVRLAHYPHNEQMVKEADRLGLMVWSEIPVYWTIKWENVRTYNNASLQLSEMIARDRNRSSVICWSVSNETPLGVQRLEFLNGLIRQARVMDSTRLVTAAMERHYIDESTQMIDDPLGEFVDVLGCNEYIGWYDGLPNKADTIRWKTIYQKPLIISEFGGSALYGLHADSLTVWSEEYQESMYKHQLAMLEKIPFLCGMSPWILMDFRSPRRQLPGIQDFRNRKGLVSDHGERKKAFYVLQKYYEEIGKNRNGY
jgi:beta-glucuronidase